MSGLPHEHAPIGSQPLEPVILAIEASQRDLSVAVRDRGGRVLVERGQGDPRESDQLMPAIDRLVLRAGWVPRDLGAVAVSTGPGGFTSLRISIATAKGICEALAIPAIDVPSAVVAAQASADPAVDARVDVALGCKGSGFWCTSLAWQDGRWQLEHEGPADAESWSPSAPLLLADGHLPDAARARAAARGVRIAEPALGPEACLAAAVALQRDGMVADAMALRPRYARVPEAVTLWKARQGG